MDPTPQEKIISSFLGARKILIADPHGASRGGLTKIIVAMGAKPSNIVSVDNFADAQRTIQEIQPEVMVVDFSLGLNNSGMDLSEETKNYKKRDEKIFILMTGNSSQSAVAQAAEEDVDVFILKPYTIKGFTDILTRTIVSKMYPSDYIKMINWGKKALEEGDADTARSFFAKATTLNERPTLAFYYQAQAALVKKLLSEAETSYQSGLHVNNVHYKCLTGIFDLLVSQKRNVDAYGIVKQIARFFPANPNRLGQVLSLAVNTSNFADIEEYYETFKEIETRNDDLVRYICASLVVCGRHFFRLGEKERALSFLKKASVSAAGKPLILREVVTVLVNNNLLREAEEVLKRFPDNVRMDAHFLIANFLVRNLAEPEKVKLIPELRTMVRDGIKEPVIWYWLIFYLVEFKKYDEADAVFSDAIQLWPEKDKYFKGVLRLEERKVEEGDEEDDDEEEGDASKT